MKFVRSLIIYLLNQEIQGGVYCLTGKIGRHLQPQKESNYRDSVPTK